MRGTRSVCGRPAALVVPAVIGVLGARIAAMLSATLAPPPADPSAAIGVALALLMLGIVLATAYVTDTPAGVVARRVAVAAVPLAMVAALPPRVPPGSTLEDVAALLAQPVPTPAAWAAIPRQAALAWFASGLALATLVLGSAWGVWRAWRVDAPPTARALVILTWALLLPVALWRVTVSPAIGDEPHYLVIAESLLHDGDIDLADDYDPETVQRVSPYLRGPVAEHVRSPGKELVSTHAGGVSALVLAAWAAAGRWGVAAVLSMLAAALTASLVVAARRLELGEHVARVAWAVGGFLSPIFVFAPLLYPEPVAACAAFGAFAVSLRGATGDANARWSDAAAGAALGALGFLHVKFLLLGATVLAVGVAWGGWRTPSRLARVAPAAALTALASLAVHLRVYHAINPYGGSGPATLSVDSLFGLHPLVGAIDLLIAPQGLLPPYPLLAFAPLGAALLARRSPRDAWRTIGPIVPFFLLYCPYVFWHGGTVPPSRMLLPVVPWFVLLAAIGLVHARRSRAGRVLAKLAATLATAFSLLGTAMPSLWLSPWLSSALLLVLPTGAAALVVAPIAVPGLGRAGLAAGALLLVVLAVVSWRAARDPLAAAGTRA